MKKNGKSNDTEKKPLKGASITDNFKLIHPQTNQIAIFPSDRLEKRTHVSSRSQRGGGG